MIRLSYTELQNPPIRNNTMEVCQQWLDQKAGLLPAPKFEAYTMVRAISFFYVMDGTKIVGKGTSPLMAMIDFLDKDEPIFARTV